MRVGLEIGEPVPRAIDGRHVLALLFAFFGIVFAVNGYFLYSALSTHTGVVSSEPYRKGLAYNQRIAADQQQTVFGWYDEITVGHDGAITVEIKGSDGQAISGLSVAATIGRPSTAAHDRVLSVHAQPTGPYSATTAALPDGAWIITLEARRSPDDAEPVYRARRRLWLKP